MPGEEHRSAAPHRHRQPDERPARPVALADLVQLQSGGGFHRVETFLECPKFAENASSRRAISRVALSGATSYATRCSRLESPRDSWPPGWHPGCKSCAAGAGADRERRCLCADGGPGGGRAGAPWGTEGGARPLPVRGSAARASLDSVPFLGPGGGPLTTDTMQDRGRRAPWAAVAVLAVALLPALVALAALPGFITSDGPAHLYNAQIIAELLRGDSVYRDLYQVRSAPLPNWGQYLLLIGLLQTVAPRTADHLATVLTLVGFAASVFGSASRSTGTGASASPRCSRRCSPSTSPGCSASSAS